MVLRARVTNHTFILILVLTLGLTLVLTTGLITIFILVISVIGNVGKTV